MKLDGVPMEWLHKICFVRTVPTFFQEGHAPVAASAVEVVKAVLRSGWLAGSSRGDNTLTGLLDSTEVEFDGDLPGHTSSSRRCKAWLGMLRVWPFKDCSVSRMWGPAGGSDPQQWASLMLCSGGPSSHSSSLCEMLGCI